MCKDPERGPQHITPMGTPLEAACRSARFWSKCRNSSKMLKSCLASPLCLQKRSQSSTSHGGSVAFSLGLEQRRRRGQGAPRDVAVWPRAAPSPLPSPRPCSRTAQPVFLFHPLPDSLELCQCHVSQAGASAGRSRCSRGPVCALGVCGGEEFGF